MRELGADLAPMRQRPGHVIIAEQDGYVGTEAMARDSAERAGAGVTLLSGVGHWWMIQDQTAGAAALESFWSTLS